MRGTLHSGSKVTGKLREEVLDIVLTDPLQCHPSTKSMVIRRLRDSEMGLNSCAGLLDKYGYKMEIKIVKK